MTARRSLDIKAYTYRDFSIIVFPTGKALVHFGTRTATEVVPSRIVYNANSLDEATTWVDTHGVKHYAKSLQE